MRHQNASCTRRIGWSCGTGLFHDSLPLVYDLNFLRLEVDKGATAVELAAEADSLMDQPQFIHRQIVVHDEDIGQRLAPGFDDLGWKVDRTVVMAHRRQPDRLIETSAVEEVDERDVWPSREKFLRTYEWCNDDETAAQMHGAYNVWMQLMNSRDLAIVRDGIPVSFAMLWMNEGTGQIEDVATLEPYRNQGLSRSIVTCAVEMARAAGCDTIFLLADADDWPKELYSKLGFDPVGFQYYFVKVNS